MPIHTSLMESLYTAWTAAKHWLAFTAKTFEALPTKAEKFIIFFLTFSVKFVLAICFGNSPGRERNARRSGDSRGYHRSSGVTGTK